MGNDRAIPKVIHPSTNGAEKWVVNERPWGSVQGPLELRVNPGCYLK